MRKTDIQTLFTFNISVTRVSHCEWTPTSRSCVMGDVRDNNRVGYRDPSVTSCTTVNKSRLILRSISSPVEFYFFPYFFSSSTLPPLPPFSLLRISSIFKQFLRRSQLNRLLFQYSISSISSFLPFLFVPLSIVPFSLSLLDVFAILPPQFIHIKRHLVSQIARSIRLAKLDPPYFYPFLLSLLRSFFLVCINFTNVAQRTILYIHIYIRSDRH